MPAIDAGLAALLRRDRLTVTAALLIVTLLAWAYVLWLAAAGDMAAMDMGAMDGMDMSEMAGAMAPAIRNWAPIDFAFMFAMWAVMMVGMMTPSVAPIVLLYAGVGRKASEHGSPIASTGWFFAGYLIVWIAFSADNRFAYVSNRASDDLSVLSVDRLEKFGALSASSSPVSAR